MAENLAYQSRVKEYIKKKGLRSDGDLPDAVSKKVRKLLDRAAERCQANDRKTVRPEDL